MSKQIRPRLENGKKHAHLHITKPERRILEIGDLHCPFDLDAYLQHCIDTYNNYNCNQVVFIGDVIDNHYSSFHEQDPDGMGGSDELDVAINRLQKYYKAFPVADVMIGNHDRIIMRKAFSGGIPKRWIKGFSEVLGTPGWNFVDRVIYDGVQYVHGEAGTARSKCKSDMMSTVQGHLHTQMYVEWAVGANFKIFGKQIGCGVDHDAYALAYAKRGKKPAIGCGVTIGGHTSFNVPMEL